MYIGQMLLIPLFNIKLTWLNVSGLLYIMTMLIT